MTSTSSKDRPGTVEALRRLRIRSAVDALTACALAVLGIAGTYLATRAAAFGALPLGEFAPQVLLVVLIGILMYRSRIRWQTASDSAAVHQERLSHVVEGTGVGIWELDLQTRIVHVSDSWLDMCGRSRASGNTLHERELCALVHPEDLPRVVATAKAGLSDTESFQFDHRLQHMDGSWIWVASRGKVVERGSDGSPRRLVGTHADITRRKSAEEALADSESRFRSLFERSPVGIALIDYKTGRFLKANDALLEPTGYERWQLLRMTLPELTAVAGDTGVDGGEGPAEREFVRRDATRYPVLMSGIRMTDASGREVVWSIVQDISHRKTVERELAAAARQDRLTGLANRTCFMEGLQHSVTRFHDSPAEHFAVLFLDFDRFKIVNDAMGHQAGDDLLVQIAQRLRETLCEGSARSGMSAPLIARFGGDEFLVLLAGLDNPEAAAAIADNLLQALSVPYSIRSREVHSTASIGIVTSAQNMADAETIVRNADVAMYESKRAGRARATLFSDGMHARLARKLQIETGLRKAIGTSQLSLVYQPIVELATGRRASVEALLRWQHPTLGAISPGEFVPVAEESGLITAIGEWVMHEACSALARWRARDPRNAPHVVSVNVSRAELAEGERLHTTVRSALQSSGLPPDCLLLEVTEREVMRDPAASLAVMKRLHAIGVHLAMDDFGTGTSSLACLRDYPFDVIKIDQSFVAGLAAGPDTLAVIHATITLVENLGKTSVAEGVETPEQLAILQSLGCHYAQGYHLGRPITEEQVQAQLAESRTVPPEDGQQRVRA